MLKVTFTAEYVAFCNDLVEDQLTPDNLERTMMYELRLKKADGDNIKISNFKVEHLEDK